MKFAAPAAIATLATALATALPATAQSNDELLKELRALRDRVAELEKRVQSTTPAVPAPAPAPGQWGMTPEQARELNRVTIKAEALQDNFTDQGFKGLKISGAIDPTYLYNRNQDNASFVFLNNGGARYSYDNSYFGMAVLDVQKETESGARWRLTLAPERGTGALFNGGSIVHEASVSLPLSDLKTRIWLGQIPDWTGYEITLPSGNKLITHNLLFDTTAPTAYTGAVLDVTRGKWWLRAGVANINSARLPKGNSAPAFIYRVDYSKGEFSGFGFSGVHGKAANFGDDGNWIDANGNVQTFAGAGKGTAVHMIEADAFFTRGDWSLFGQVSAGMQQRAAIFNSDGVLRDARWVGASALAAYKITPRLEAVLRGDYLKNDSNGGGLFGYSFDDPLNGIGRGVLASGAYAKGEAVGTNRYALSAGLNYLFDEGTVLKLELRRDGADQPVFEVVRRGTFSKSNTLFGAAVVVTF
jgi:hypothetical protein